ncbi:YfgM family protein [Sphaerotilus natans]|uniref:YfgM family protein n=1 Tax=Sphaerotilus natans TaxID=34103 RepID=UPI00406C9C45
MASHLDLEEQEQLDQLKAFWNRFGNLILSLLLVVLTAYAGWNGWQWWQRDQASKAGGVYDELERAVQAGDADRAAKVFADLKSRYGSTAFAGQGGLLTARVQSDKGQTDAARATLEWVAADAGEDEYRAIAKLRLAALKIEAKQPDEALRLLEGLPESFAALAADRRGDILLAKGQRAEAVAAYQQAWKGLEAGADYRRLVEAKLGALGAAPEAAPVASADGAAK